MVVKEKRKNVESKSLYKHSNRSVLQNIDEWYISESEKHINFKAFGVGEKKVNIEKYRVLKALDNIICRNLECDLKVTDELLEATDIYIHTNKFKVIQ